jgi:hypothetical protein
VTTRTCGNGGGHQRETEPEREDDGGEVRGNENFTVIILACSAATGKDRGHRKQRRRAQVRGETSSWGAILCSIRGVLGSRRFSVSRRCSWCPWSGKRWPEMAVVGGAGAEEMGISPDWFLSWRRGKEEEAGGVAWSSGLHVQG